MYGVAEKFPGLSVEDSGTGKYRRTIFRFTDCVLALADVASTVAFKGLKLYTMPEGINQLQTIGANLTLERTSTGINADFDGDFGVGTVTAGGDATLSSTEQDVIPTTATTQAVGGVSNTKYASGTVIVQDGSAGAKPLFLNILVDDADQDLTTTPGGLKVNGTIELNWTIGPDK